VSLQIYDVKFPYDSVNQKLLKSVNFSPSYSKCEERAFFDTQCIICKLSTHINKIFSKYNGIPKESTLSQIKYAVWSTVRRTGTYFFTELFKM